MTTPCLSEDALLAYMNRESDGFSRAASEAHLASCDECRSLVSALLAGSVLRPSLRIDPLGATVHADATRNSAERGPPAGAPFSISPGVRIDGKYQLESELGRGGMGSVWAAYHEHLRQRVAIKFLHGGAASEDEARKRFLLEARSLAKLSGEHVVRVLDAKRAPER